ncbi:MFS general substrate transporter [Dichomitus squalens LYAD-421 SS1]|uniref:MFS general substrate transporter n=1 Tax=Dichomitus squalens (strain LYAD-421) TaxID=732165 RepID=R7T2Q0_DICSQ|nr:MFS general substrate transporter [Dichomitus squalens LYAD-421 SS1]EJF61842.1 MFS general substrate transporter [Dichomitus squalens LYAD-421 SS1]
MTLDDQTLPSRPGSIREEDVKLEEGHAVRESALSEGTFHQSQVVGKAIRKHFFCPPDATLADAVNRDADNVEFTDAEEKAVRRKIDRRVLTLVVSSYILNQFDRTNIGNAHVLKAFNDNFGITNNNQWTLALSIFYVGYCLLEMPANVLQRYIGANRFLFLSLTWWGLASVSFVYAKGYGGLLALRVLLGIGEAGYYAGMIYYLSFWYKRSELALRIRWQLLFLVEAIPTIFMAIVTLLFLPSFPFSSSFLTPREKAIAQARLNRDHRPKSHGGMTGWEGFKAVVNDIHAWLLMFMYASFNVGATSIVYFLPTLINELGFSPLASQGLTVAPYVVGWLMVVFQAWHSDKTRDRGYHIMLSTAVSCIGYIVLAVLATRGSGSNMIGGRYFALFLVVGGNYSLFPLVMSWAANVFSPTSKRGVGTAFIVSISNCVSIASPQVYFDANDNYQKGHAISAALVVSSPPCQVR